MVALVEMLDGVEQEMWPFLGREAAKTHAASSYSSFIRNGPESLIEHFPVYWPLLHSSGRWEVALDPGSGFATMIL